MSLPAAYLAAFEEPFGYLDFAAIGPPGARVREAVGDGLARAAAPDGSVGASVFGAYEAALATVARFLGVPPERATVVPSTSAGLFQVAFGLLGRSGNVVVPAHEFPANVYPWLRAEAAGGPEVRLVEVPDRRVTATVLRTAVDADTVAVAVSLVDYATGFRVDLEELRSVVRDALLVVDAIQGLGAVRCGLGPADVLVAGGQKWLRAGWGAGVMAASARALDGLEPTLAGWWGVEDAFDFVTPAPHAPRSDAERFHPGSPDAIGALAAAAAIETIEIAGIDAIETAVLDRSAAVMEGVATVGAEVRAPWRGEGERAGIVTFRLPDEPAAATVARLGTSGFVVSERSGWVRAAPHATTALGAIDELVEALAAR